MFNFLTGTFEDAVPRRTSSSYTKSYRSRLFYVKSVMEALALEAKEAQLEAIAKVKREEKSKNAPP